MTTAHYAIVRSKATRWRGPSIPVRFYLRSGIPTDLPTHATAVYITELGDGRCAYVGQTRRGATARLVEHAAEWERAQRWCYVWVVPIVDAVPDRELTRVEGRIGRFLRPVDARTLPRPY